jgi:hypothetical protein
MGRGRLLPGSLLPGVSSRVMGCRMAKLLEADSFTLDNVVSLEHAEESSEPHARLQVSPS